MSDQPLPTSEKQTTPYATQDKQPFNWDIPVFFGLILALALAELGFSTDTFQYKQKTHTWDSNTERARIAFLIFSSVRTSVLAAVYIGFHWARKWFHNTHHTIFVVFNFIFWIVSGVLIHTMFGLIECGGVGVLKGGLSECHELKIIEVLSWVIAGLSVLAAVPILMRATKRRGKQVQQGEKEQRAGGPGMGQQFKQKLSSGFAAAVSS